MADDDFDPDVVQRYLGASRVSNFATINSGMEMNPDQAADAHRLSEMTGDPPAYVANNYDEYAPELKRQAARSIVTNNPMLMEYANSHPLAPAISNDDWATLDQFTRASPWKGHGLGADVVGLFTGDETLAGQAGDKSLPFSQRLLAAIGEEGRRMVMGAAQDVTQAVAPVYGEGSPEAQAQAIPSLAMQTVLGQGGLRIGREKGSMDILPPEPKAAAAPAKPLMLEAKPWIDAEREPPAGVSPEVDGLKADLNSEYLDRVEEDLRNASASTTRERSPEMFQQLTDRMYGQDTIGLHADAVLKLYGDKPPAVDDGLLGWVPGIDQQLAAARDMGTDVQIPLADFVAKVDPALAKALRDDLRIWPGGVTGNEVKAQGELPPAEPVPDQSTIGAVRQGMGTTDAPTADNNVVFMPGAGAHEEFKPQSISVRLEDIPPAQDKLKDKSTADIIALRESIESEDYSVYKNDPNWYATARELQARDVPYGYAAEIATATDNLVDQHSTLNLTDPPRVPPANDTGQGQGIGTEPPQGPPGEPPSGGDGSTQPPAPTDPSRPVVEGASNLTPEAIGMDAVHFERYQKALQAQAEGDLAAATRTAEREQKRRQGQEWKAQRVEVHKEVAATIRQRPDVMASEFLERTAAADLDPELVANRFGYGTAAEMQQAVDGLEAQRQQPNGKPMQREEFIRKLIGQETDRQMEVRYGNLARNTLEAAEEQALGMVSFNAQYERYRGVAESNGVTAYDRGVILRAAKNALAEFPIGKVSSYRLMSDMGRDARNAQRALVDGKPIEAAVHLQRQTMNMAAAAEAKALEKEIAKFNKDAVRWGKFKFGEAQSPVPSEYANVIQHLLWQVGKRVGASPEFLRKEMAESGWGKDVRGFVDEKTKWGAVLEPDERFYDPTFRKKFDDLSVDEFRAVDGFIRSLVHNGRLEKQVFRQGEAADFDTARGELIAKLQALSPAGQGVVAKSLRTVGSLLITHENYTDLWDRWDWKGPWNSYFYRPLKEADNIEAARYKEVVEDIQKIVDRGNAITGDVPNTLLRSPITGQPLVTSRRALWSAMLNQGNADNIEHFAAGWSIPSLKYKVTPEAVREWIDTHATKADWDGVQQIWDVLRKTGDWSDEEYRRMSGRGMRRIEPQEVQTPHGTYPGGYYPKMFHPDYPGRSETLLGLSKDALFGSGYGTGFVPGAGYRIQRTDYRAPLALDLDQLPRAIMEQIHDGAVRGAVMQAAKILRDPDVKSEIIRRAGLEVYDSHVKWVRRIANARSPMGDLTIAGQRGLQALDFLRRNAITNMIGLNLGTVEKHGPTALVTSIEQVGLGRMLKAYTQLWGTDEESGLAVRKAIHAKSLEIQRRNRGWMENLYGSVQDIHFGNSAWDKVMRGSAWLQWASTKPVALSDALSAEPLFWARYRQARDEMGEDEGGAVYYAEKGVRKGHGSTAVTSQPMVMNEMSKWFVPVFNFYNDVMNRAVESYWHAREGSRDYRAGDKDAWFKNMKLAASGAFVSLVMPVIIHNLVDPPKQGQNDSTPMKLLRYVGHPYAAFFPIIRDLVPFIMGGDAPDVGLFTAAYKQAGQMFKDFGERGVNGPAQRQKLIKDGGTFLGFVTGIPGTQLGRWAGAGYGLASGQEKLQGPVSAHDLIRFGTTKGHARTLQEYRQGGFDRRR